MKIFKKLVIATVISTMLMNLCYAQESKADTKTIQTTEGNIKETEWEKNEKLLFDSIKEKGEKIEQSVSNSGLIFSVENVYKDEYSLYAIVSVKKEDHTAFDEETAKHLTLVKGYTSLETLAKGNTSRHQGAEMCSGLINTADTLYFLMKDRSTSKFKEANEVKIHFDEASIITHNEGNNNKKVLTNGPIEMNVKVEKQGKTIEKKNINKAISYQGKNDKIPARLDQIIVTPTSVYVYIDQINAILGSETQGNIQVKMKDGTLYTLEEKGTYGLETGDDEKGPSGIDAKKISMYEPCAGILDVEQIDSVIIGEAEYTL